MKKLSFASVLFLTLLLFQSCLKDNQTDPKGQKAPELPKSEMFIMPFSDFEEIRGEDDSRTVSHWGYAASTVVAWNAVLTLHLAIPVAAFYESFNHQATYEGDGVWRWAYSVTNNGHTYHARLFGELLDSDEIKWDMYIKQQGGFAEMHWYTGITALDRSYAHWTLNANPANPFPFIEADYQRDNGSGFESIRYTNIIPGAPENGGHIEFRQTTPQTVNFNKAYDVYNSQIDNLLEIQWNNPGYNGRVKDPEYFNDTEWHCWDSNLQNVDC